MAVTSTSFVPLKVAHFEGLPPWGKKNFTWLSDPRLYNPALKAYELESGRKLVYESVLNHRLSKTEIEPGGSCEGVLLAYSIETRIPIDYLHRETFSMCIVLIDHFGRSHPSIIEVRVDRSATMRMPDPGKRGTGLYGRSRASQAKVVAVKEDLRRPQRQPATTGFGDDTLELQKFRGSREKTRVLSPHVKNKLRAKTEIESLGSFRLTHLDDKVRYSDGMVLDRHRAPDG